MAQKKKKLSKKELKEKDQILTGLEKGWNVLEQHSMKVVGILVGGVAVTAIWAIWGHFSYRSDAAASRKFNKALRAYNAPVMPEGIHPEELPDGEDVLESYSSEKERAKAALALFEQLKADHGSKRVARIADFYIGNCHFHLENFDEAIKVYKSFLSGESTGCRGRSGSLPPALKLVALENLAYSYEGKGDYDNALSYFSRLEEAEGGLKKELAVYHQARIWELKGDPGKAIELYRRVKTVDAHAVMSPMRTIAERRALYLETGMGVVAEPEVPEDGRPSAVEEAEPAVEEEVEPAVEEEAEPAAEEEEVLMDEEESGIEQEETAVQ